MPDTEKLLSSQQQAHAVLEVENVDEEQRIISGVASTPTPDRVKDVIVPAGIKYAAEIPLLLHHDHKSPVGTVKLSTSNNKLLFSATIAKIEEEGTLKSRTDEAWQSVKAGLIRGVSIGFSPDAEKASYNNHGGITFASSEVFELSLVTIPCNREATIETVKSLDVDYQKTDISNALNKDTETTKTEVTRNAPVNVDDQRPGNNNKAHNIMSYTEQIKSFEEKRTQLKARLDDVMSKSMADGRGFDTDEAKSFDEVSAEIEGVEAHLERLKKAEKLSGQKAQPIAQHNHEEVNRDVTKVFATPKNTQIHEKGLGFAKFAKIMGQSRGNLMQAEYIAKSCGDERVYNAITKAATLGTTTSPDYSALVEYQTLENEFVELLRPQTILGQIDGFREIPFNVRIAGQTGATTASWVGEGERKPATSAAFNATEHGWKKLAGIVVLSEELLRDSSPSADRLIRDDLTRTIAQELDAQFILPGRTGTAAAPASVTSQATAVAATGQTATDLRKDVTALFSAMLTANLSTGGSVVVMSEVQALRIGMLTNDLGQPEFPQMMGDAKSLYGHRVVTSEAVGNNIVLMKPSEIYMSTGAVVLDSSNQASITLDGGLINLYEQNSVAIRAEKYQNWSLRRDAAVQYISGANYDGTVSAA